LLYFYIKQTMYSTCICIEIRSDMNFDNYVLSINYATTIISIFKVQRKYAALLYSDGCHWAWLRRLRGGVVAFHMTWTTAPSSLLDIDRISYASPIPTIAWTDTFRQVQFFVLLFVLRIVNTQTNIRDRLQRANNIVYS